ncbi:MAG: hypothetical protein AAF999_12895 [Pseudomonadota bacterium]
MHLRKADRPVLILPQSAMIRTLTIEAEVSRGATVQNDVMVTGIDNILSAPTQSAPGHPALRGGKGWCRRHRRACTAG